eukprot:481198_1
MGSNGKTKYGVDHPNWFFNTSMLWVLLIIINLSGMHLTGSMLTFKTETLVFRILFGITTPFSLLVAFLYYFSSVTKQQIRLKIIEKVKALKDWKGNENILDVGCGSGVFTVAIGLSLKKAYQRLKDKQAKGKVIGIDIWDNNVHSKGSPENVKYNANVEGCLEFVDSKTGDASNLSEYKDKSFDMVFCFFVLHHIPKKKRQTAMNEMIRVLKPGGRFALADPHTNKAIDKYFKHHLENGTLIRSGEPLPGSTAATFMWYLLGMGIVVYQKN